MKPTGLDASILLARRRAPLRTTTDYDKWLLTHRRPVANIVLSGSKSGVDGAGRCRASRGVSACADKTGLRRVTTPGSSLI